jgi:imidazolonepropionase-like amidohydrolase
MGVEDVIREAFVEAKAYKAEWDAWDTKKTGIPPRKDLKLEALKEVLEGKRYVHAHCYRADEILMLLRVADEFGFKIRTLQHVLEGYKVAKEIAAHGAGASTFSDWWSYKMEAFDAIPFNAAIMMKKGVVVSINSDDAEQMRHLNIEAGKAMKYGGATETEALAMVTLNPAKQLGIDNRVGSIETGKDADLVIYDKFPLSDYAKVQKVLIDGTVYFDRDNEVSGRPTKAAEKQKLVDKEKRPTAPPARRPGQ